MQRRTVFPLLMAFIGALLISGRLMPSPVGCLSGKRP